MRCRRCRPSGRAQADPTIATASPGCCSTRLSADFVCVGLRAGASAVAVPRGLARTPRDGQRRSESICAAVTRWCSEPDPDPNAIDLPPTRTPVVVTPIGIAAEHGVIVDGGEPSAIFRPTSDRLLLNVARQSGDGGLTEPPRPATRSGLPTRCSGSAARSPRNSTSRKSCRRSPMRRPRRPARISAPSFTTSSIPPANPTCCTRWPARRAKRSPAFRCRAIRRFSVRRSTGPAVVRLS